MNLLSLALLCCCCVVATTTENKQDIVEYLVDYGYLESTTFTKIELKKALRQLQKENNFIVNGKITPEVNNLVKYEIDKKMVIEYLKTFGYIQGTIDPNSLKNAVKILQRNSGVLAITGIINEDTVNFIKSHLHGYSEPLNY